MRGSNILTDPPIIRKKKVMKASFQSRFTLAQEASDVIFRNNRALLLSKGSLAIIEGSNLSEAEKIGDPLGLSPAGAVYLENGEVYFKTFARIDRDLDGTLYPETSHIGNDGLSDDLVFAYAIEKDGEVILYGKDKEGKLYKACFRKDSPSDPPIWQRIYQEAVDLGAFLATDDNLFISYKDKNSNDEDVALVSYPKESRQNHFKIEAKIHGAEKFVVLGEEPLFLHEGKVLKSDGTPAIEDEEEVVDISKIDHSLALLFKSGRVEVQREGKVVFSEKDMLGTKAPMFSKIDRILIDEEQIMLLGKKARQVVTFRLGGV